MLTPVSVPLLASALYCTLIVPADAAACVTSSVCPLNVPTGVRSVLSAMMLMRSVSATVVVMSPTAGELLEPLALTAETSSPPSFCTTKATITARSLTDQLTVYDAGSLPAVRFHKQNRPESGTPDAGIA